MIKKHFSIEVWYTYDSFYSNLPIHLKRIFTIATVNTIADKLGTNALVQGMP